MLGNILSTGEQVLILVVLLAVGFLCGKIRIFNDQSISHLSAFALKIGPCAIVESFCRQFDSAMLRAMGIVALLAFAAHALYAAFAYVCIRGGKEPTRRVLRKTNSTAVSAAQMKPASPRWVKKSIPASKIWVRSPCKTVRSISSTFIKRSLSRFVVYRIPEVYE